MSSRRTGWVSHQYDGHAARVSADYTARFISADGDRGHRLPGKYGHLCAQASAVQRLAWLIPDDHVNLQTTVCQHDDAS